MKKYIALVLILQSCLQTKNDKVVSAENISDNEPNTYCIEGVCASNEFAGGRLSNFEKTGEKTYLATISPENIPVNPSAWFAFQLWGAESEQIEITLQYTHHKHRYVPKLSVDYKNWSALNDGIMLNNDSTTATFTIAINSVKTWVAAQELYSSADTDLWAQSLLERSNLLELEKIGKTVSGDKLTVLKHEVDSLVESVVLVARQHPPEIPGGTIGFKSFVTEVLSGSELAQEFRNHFNLYIFPLVNPDGADLGNWRHNANGVDLNRDWQIFSQPETQSIRDYLNKKVDSGKKIKFGIDFHTSHSGPYLLILDSLNASNMRSKIISSWVNSIDNDSLAMNDYRRRSQELPYFYNWIYNSFGAEAVTYEDGDEVSRDVIKGRAKIYAQHWMNSMLKNNQ